MGCKSWPCDDVPDVPTAKRIRGPPISPFAAKVLEDHPGLTTAEAKIVGDMSIDQDALLVSWKNHPINLSGTEFRMLAKLVRVPGHAVSYDTLMNATMQSLVTNNTINTHMRNIRKKFETIDPDFKCIKSEYGFGYRWSTQ